jgi:hypothetical protein
MAKYVAALDAALALVEHYRRELEETQAELADSYQSRVDEVDSDIAQNIELQAELADAKQSRDHANRTFGMYLDLLYPYIKEHAPEILTGVQSLVTTARESVSEDSYW